MKNKIVKSEKEWREQLTESEFQVTRRKGTERAFAGELHNCKDAGTYRCVCCGNALFDSEAKFDSGSGWPSFTQAVDGERVETVEDTSLSMRRTEVTCGRCDAHLGHLFDDGPTPTGQRFCINSIALKLDKRQED